MSCASSDGRRYDALDDAAAPVAGDVASYLARTAFFEAASIDAFEILARELRASGAPRALVRGCFAARGDEVRHARMARNVAKRHGAVHLPMPEAGDVLPRSLAALAIENVVEGCVREAFGVVLGLWQAVHAPTQELRAFFAQLAEDEARHAALAWSVDTWARAQLDASTNARIDRARDAALEALATSLAEVPVEGLGLPSPRDARVLFDAFAHEVTSLRSAA